MIALWNITSKGHIQRRFEKFKIHEIIQPKKKILSDSSQIAFKLFNMLMGKEDVLNL